MPAKTNEALIRADELFASDYVNHAGLIPDVVRGPEAIKISVVMYRLAFPNLYIAVEDLSTQGEIVVLHWTARNRCPAGPGGDTPSTDRTVLNGITRSRISDGKVAESWTEWTGSHDYVN